MNGIAKEQLEQEWRNYRDITNRYVDCSYNRLEKVKIDRRKAGWGGCCYSKGSLIGIPNSARMGLRIDPKGQTAKIFGRTRIGTFKWTGGCAYQGSCYGFPRKENSLLVIDPDREKTQEIKLGTHYRGEHHYGGAVTPEGMLYQSPRNTDHILRIDLNTYETKQISMPGIGGGCRYSSCVLHPNGMIYLIPEFGYCTAVLNPDTEEVMYIGEPSEHLVFGAVVGYDGNIYGFSKQGDGILRIDTEWNRVDYVCREIGNPDCYGSVVGINGRIYGIPGGGDTIWEYDIAKESVISLYRLQENGYAKCAGAGVGCDGTIVMIPCFGEYLYFLRCSRNPGIKEEAVASLFLNTTY